MGVGIGVRTGEDERLDLLVVAQRPHHEAPEVRRVDELAQRLPRAPDHERLVVTCTTATTNHTLQPHAHQTHGYSYTRSSSAYPLTATVCSKCLVRKANEKGVCRAHARTCEAH